MLPSLVRFAVLILSLSLSLSGCMVFDQLAEQAEAEKWTPAPASSSSAAPTFDPPPAPFAHGQVCTVEPDHLYAPAGACFVVTADEWSTLGTCEGTIAENYVGKTWVLDCDGCGRNYPTSSFEIPGGGCYRYFNCSPDGVLPPLVEPCP